MKSEFSAARMYADFNGFAELRAAARDNSPEAAKEVGRQFEALLVQMMLKSMRAAGFGDALFDSDATRLHRDLFDQQLALSFSRRGELGIASLIERSIAGNAAPQSNTAHGAPLDASALRPADVDRQAAPTSPGNDVSSGRSEGFASHDAFVRELWPAASRAGRALGVDPELLIAQAALETGWGQAIIHDGRGRSSHNLFGIKADGRWPGLRMTVKSLEYEDGVAVPRQAQFRSYDSFAESFDDYATLVRTSPRYGDALRQASDPQAYMHALQAAGYATDPNYAAKVLDIYSRRIAAAIKLAQVAPL